MARMLLFIIVLAGSMARSSRADDPPAYDRKEDVIYGRKYGTRADDGRLHAAGRTPTARR